MFEKILEVLILTIIGSFAVLVVVGVAGAIVQIVTGG